MHTSIKLDTPCELINIVPVNPLISKCEIKVCYVSDDPNRNKSVITKEVAREMANSIPGSPIVGFFNELSGDFEEHNRELKITKNSVQVVDTTRPYGFVDLGAKVWFQKFNDVLDSGESVVHEYLMTEGYIWTGQYPESKRIFEKGNNQSMELDKDTLDGYWAKDDNGKPKFFIINTAIMSKLCILGEEVEPCFEGSQIGPVKFSLEDSFKEELFSLMQDMKKVLKEGGTQVFTTYAVNVGDSVWTAIYANMIENGHKSIEAVLQDGEQKFAVIRDADNKALRLNFSLNDDGVVSFDEYVELLYGEYTPSETTQFPADEVEAFEASYKKKPEDDEEKDEGKTDKGEPSESEEPKKDDDDSDNDDSDSDDKGKDDKKDKKKNNYSLEEIPEYVELQSQYSALEEKYNTLIAEKEQLEAKLGTLEQFKLDTEKVQKEKMINETFYMLSDEDKKDVIENIDTYSLDDIEAKLSIICFRNKVNFSNVEDPTDPLVYNYNDADHDDGTPDWVKAVLATEKTLN